MRTFQAQKCRVLELQSQLIDRLGGQSPPSRPTQLEVVQRILGLLSLWKLSQRPVAQVNWQEVVYLENQLARQAQMYLRLRTQILLLEVEALALRAEMGEISREHRGVHRGPAQTHQQMAWRYQWQTGQQLARHRADMRKTIKGVKLTTNQYQQEAEALGLKKKELRGQQEDLRAHKVAQASEAEHRARQRQAQLGDRLGRLVREFEPLRMSLNGIAHKGTLKMDTLVTSELDYVCFRLANFFEGLATRVAALIEPVQRRPV